MSRLYAGDLDCSPTLRASRYSRMRACSVSVLGTQPMSPELGDSGMTAYLGTARNRTSFQTADSFSDVRQIDSCAADAFHAMQGGSRPQLRC